MLVRMILNGFKFSDFSICELELPVVEAECGVNTDKQRMIKII